MEFITKVSYEESQERLYNTHTYITIMTPPFWKGFYRSLKEILVGTFWQSPVIAFSMKNYDDALVE